MKAAAGIFVIAAAFLAAVVLGPVRVGSSSPAPPAIELPRAATSESDAGARPHRHVRDRLPSRTEVRKTVESGAVAGYTPAARRNEEGRGR
jgi:hypothetical protein